MALLDLVSNAVWLKNTNFYELVNSNPVYSRLINTILTSTNTSIKGIIWNNYDKQQLLDEIDSLLEIWKASSDSIYIDQALIIAYSIFDSINLKISSNFTFSIDSWINDLSNSNDDFIRKLVKKINDLLIYKCWILFWNWWEFREKAIEIATIQIDDLLSKNYTWFSTYLYKWETLRNWWYELIEEEKREKIEVETKQDKRFDYLNQWIKKWDNEINKLNKLLKEDDDEQKRFNIMLDLWQINQALDLCLERLDFFSPQQEIDWIYNYLDLIRHNLIKWKENIILLLNDKWLKIEDKYYLWYFDILIRLKSYDDAWFIAKNRFLIKKNKEWKDNLEYLIWNKLLSENTRRIILSFVKWYWITE